jgi:hypothetical protein
VVTVPRIAPNRIKPTAIIPRSGKILSHVLDWVYWIVSDENGDIPPTQTKMGLYMRKITLLVISLLVLAGLAAPVMAAEWSTDQTAVWSVISQSWEDEVARNGKWPADYIHKDVVAWGASWPQPRNGASMIKWSRFSEQAGKTLIYELFPVAVVVVNDTAVVNYNVVMETENYEMKRKRTAEGLIETLVRDGERWKFLALTSFEIKSND